MRLALLSSGDEVLWGQVVDSNAAWLADFFSGRGYEVVLHLTVGDDLGRLVDALEAAGRRADAVIVTGGLGPTSDDLTTEAVCRFAGRSTALNARAREMLEARFKAIGREMSPSNLKQAMLPEGAGLLENPIGTAAGYHLPIGGAHYFFLPGVPREMTRMAEHEVLPVLEGLLADRRAVRQKIFRLFGQTESRLGELMDELRLDPAIKVGYRAAFPEIFLKLTAADPDPAAAEAALARAVPAVKAKVGEWIFSEDGRSLSETVGGLLRDRGLRLAVAESCTGGLIAKLLTDAPGSSDYFDRAYVVYSDAAKTDLLGVPPHLLAAHGAVSAEAAVAMAQSARERSGADLALSATGIAGPGGGTAAKPVGTVHLALADAAGVAEQKFFFPRPDRAFVRELTAFAALEGLRRRLLGKPWTG